MFFNKLFQKRADRTLSTQLAYEMIVAQARHPSFYLAANVEDSVDGRFDMLVLHVYLLINRMNADESERTAAFSQGVFDHLFEDMDRSLREMGVGDLSVGKKIKKMAQVFYGRVKVYDDGLKTYAEAPGELEDALRRNIYAGRNESGEAAKLAAYMYSSSEHLGRIDTASLLKGELSFPEPETCL
ncbi:MAG: ubiquinol-cytochrome C chaperone [Rhizobiales bacterium]|nr:ubiquinol-cytochrome C chaperone [Hyphomicrobiales bacterium]